MSLDAAALEVARHRFAAIAEEMGAVLRRSASSPNIKERADCSAALFTPAGELLAQAEHIPVHLGSMPASVAAVLERATGWAPGDLWAINDPFAGGTHLNDLTLVAPVVVGGQLAGFVANRAHHADLGGTAPGSMWAEATEIYQEGLRVPPVWAGTQGRLDRWFVDLVSANSRTPDERHGDLLAQSGACVLGVTRVEEIVAEGGLSALEAAMAAILDYAERRTRAALAAIPPGEYQFEDWCDSSGPGGPPIRIALTLRIGRGSVEADFTGSDPQPAGNMNAVEAVTRSALLFALRTVMDPEIPVNGGGHRPVRLVSLPGTVVSATLPAAVAAGNVEVSQRIADVCLGALAQALPDEVAAAGHGSMNNLLIGGEGFVYYETTGGGEGGGPHGPGADAVQTAMTNTLNTPIEALEHAYPLRVRVYEIRRGSGGRGRHRGGDGIVRQVEVQVPAIVSLITERRTRAPWGLAGGEDGMTGANWLVHQDGSAEPLPDKVTRHLAAGEAVRIESAGGGGWGVEPTGEPTSQVPAAEEARREEAGSPT